MWLPQPPEVAAAILAGGETEAGGVMLFVNGESLQVAEPGFEPRQAAFRPAFSHPLHRSECFMLPSVREPGPVFTTPTASPRDTCFKMCDACFHAGLRMTTQVLEKREGTAEGPELLGPAELRRDPLLAQLSFT